MIEPMSSSLNGKWKISKAKATAVMCSLGFLFSLFFATGGGTHLLEIVDHFITNFGLVTVGLLECIILGWMFKLRRLRDHANETSEIKIGRWWEILIKYVIPAVLVILLLVAIVQNVLNNPYPDYPTWVIIVAGISPLIIITVISFILMKIKGKEEEDD
jgi:NSS family neurotransmitter:Na+ symporter